MKKHGFLTKQYSLLVLLFSHNHLSGGCGAHKLNEDRATLGSDSSALRGHTAQRRLVFAAAVCFFLFQSQALALVLNDCQCFVVSHWPRYNFTGWAVSNLDFCSVGSPTLADANAIGEVWVNE